MNLSLPTAALVPGCLLLGALLTGCEPTGQSGVSLGTLEVDRVSLKADSSEPIVAIHVTEGDSVQIDDALVEQDASRLSASMKGAEADLAVARARLAEAEAGPRQQDIAAARAELAATESNVRTLLAELNRERSLAQRNYASQNQLDILEGRYETAVATRAQAEARLEQLLEGTRSEEIDVARSNYAQAQARVEALEISLARSVITSPVPGRVEAILFEVGERPQPGEPVITLLENQTPWARIHVREPLKARLAVGAEAEISIDGHEGTYRGRLRWISSDASYTPYFALTQHDRSHLSYLAEVDVTDERAPELSTGVPVQVRFPGIDD